MPTASHPNKRPKRSSHSSSTLSDPASSPSDTDTDPRARRRTINTTVGTKRKRGVSEASSVRSGRAPRRDHSKTVSDVGRKIVGRAGKAKGDVFDKTVGVGRSSLRSEGSSTGRLDKVEMEIEDPEGFDLINSSDDHLINQASKTQLQRTRKDELVRLWKVAGLWEESSDETELTKPILIDGLLDARRPSRARTASQPSSYTSSNSSTSARSSLLSDDEHSSAEDADPTPRRPTAAKPKKRGSASGPKDKGDGNEAGGEETGEEDEPLGTLSLGPIKAKLRGRGKSVSVSVGVGKMGSPIGSKTKRRHSEKNVPSQTLATPKPHPLPQTRSRTNPRRAQQPTSPLSGRLKPRRTVTFSPSDPHLPPNGKRSDPNSSASDRSASVGSEGSKPNGWSKSVSATTTGAAGGKGKRKGEGTKGRVHQIPTPPSDADEESLDEDLGEREQEEEEESGAEEEEAEKRATRRSGLRKISVKPIVELTEDEEEDEEEEEVEVEVEVEEEDEQDQGDDMQSVAEEDDEDGDEEEEAEGEDQEYVSDDQATSEPQENEEDMSEEDDIDLNTYTHATLLRLRRDALVKLCCSRDIDVAGTKPQLAQALLDWRDNEPDDAIDSSSSISSVSSQSTARPDSSSPPKNKRHHRRLHDKDPVFNTTAKVTPTLLRPSHVHHEQKHPSVTPPPSGHAHQAVPGTEELNLDLESLGLEDKEIPCEQLVKMEKVGSGGFKDVYVGKLRNRMKVAIAEFRGQLSEMDIKELKLLADFNHPNIVKFLGVSIPEDRKIPIMMISELCENGDLFDYIRNVSAPTKKVVVKLMLDISRGLNYLHTRKPAVIHRDCKSSNILITSKVVAKVGDFGLARVKHSTRSMIRSLVGTVCYQPPEMWTAHPKYDSKVDVYSCAMVFWEMLQWHKQEKKYPWEGMNEHAIYDTVGSKKLRPSTHKVSGYWGIDVVELMEEMWVQDPKQRPTMAEVVDRLEVILKKT